MENNKTDTNVQCAQAVHDPDEINLLEYIYAIVKHKWLIFGVTALGLIGGYIAARVKGPTWVAEVVIAPKEAESQKAPNLSSLGAFGGLVASQLNMGGDASLDKIETLLDSRDFNARLVEKYSLLPQVYKYKWPKSFKENWDSTANTWKKTFREPHRLDVGNTVKGTFLKKTTKENKMTLEISSRDSALSQTLAEAYLAFLDDDIKSSVRNDAKENVSYLERQLVTIGDPLLREKIQTLIADEIEKTMVVSKEAFRVVDPVYLQRKFKEKKLYPMVFGAGLFFMVVVLVVMGHAFGSAKKTEEDMALLTNIRKSLFLPV